VSLDWSLRRAGFISELEKISEVNTSGISPQTMLEHGSPNPTFQTPGLQKADRVLERIPSNIQKEAKVRAPRRDPYLRARPFLGSAIRGAGSGALLSRVLLGGGRKRILSGVVAGAGIGLLDRAYVSQNIGRSVKFTPNKKKLSSAFVTPAQRLRAAKMVGSPSKAIKNIKPIL